MERSLFNILLLLTSMSFVLAILNSRVIYIFSTLLLLFCTFIFVNTIQTNYNKKTATLKTALKRRNIELDKLKANPIFIKKVKKAEDMFKTQKKRKLRK